MRQTEACLVVIMSSWMIGWGESLKNLDCFWGHFSIYCSKWRTTVSYWFDKSWVDVRTLRRSTCKYKWSQCPEILLMHFKESRLTRGFYKIVQCFLTFRLFKSKPVTGEDEEDAAQAGVNKASKGGIIYGDYLQVENHIYILEQSLSKKNNRVMKWVSETFHFSSYLSFKRFLTARFCRAK